MSRRIASKTTLNWPPYFFSRASILRASSEFEASYLPKRDEGTHDLYIDLHCPFAPKHAEKHGNTLFSKGKWKIFSMPTTAYL
jgi:hypothetical protein